MEHNAPTVRPRRRWHYPLAVVAFCCVVGIVVWKWTRRPPAFDITGSWSVRHIPPSNSTAVTLTFTSDGTIQMNGTPTWQWRMEGNRIRFGTGLSLFGGRGPSIPYYPDSLAYVAKQDLDTGEVILSQSGLGPTIVLTRVDAGDADDSDTPTE